MGGSVCVGGLCMCAFLKVIGQERYLAQGQFLSSFI